MGVLSRTPAPIDCDHPAAADLLRVLAAWAVGAFHIWQQSWYSGAAPAHWLRAGSVGVDWLVLLSAFCLFLPWANAAAQGRPLPLTRPAVFYRRRAVRLLPAYYASLLFSLVPALYRAGWSRTLGIDLAAHLTLTQQLFPQSYLATRLNGVTWTLTVFALFYLVFPLLAPLCVRCPLPTLGALCAVQLGYTLWALPQYGSDAYSSLFNQFPAFCGVLAVGLAAALVFARLARGGWTQRLLPRAGCTVLGVLALVWLNAHLRAQAYAAEFQQFQLINRMPLALAAAAMLVGFGLGLTPPRPVRRALAWLSALTYSFYLWHQQLTVFLKYDLHLPAWTGTTPPNQLGDTAWMRRAEALYWLAALAVSIAAYYLIEKPAARHFKKTPQKMHAEKARQKANLPGGGLHFAHGCGIVLVFDDDFTESGPQGPLSFYDWSIFMAKPGKPQQGSAVKVVEALVRPVVEGMDLRLWDVRFEKEGPDWFLRVLIDRDEPLDTDTCEAVSRAIDPLLDEADPIEQSYYLEVGSPGLGRRLTRPEHYEQLKGQKCAAHLIRPDEQGRRDYAGILQGLDADGNVTLTDGEETYAFPVKSAGYVKLCDDEDLFG